MRTEYQIVDLDGRGGRSVSVWANRVVPQIYSMITARRIFIILPTEVFFQNLEPGCPATNKSAWCIHGRRQAL